METQPSKSPEQILAARRELWRRGLLSWKLTSTQKELYDLFHNSTFKVMTWLLARRSGKSYTLCVLALEQCLRKPNSIVKFLSPTKTQIHTNLRPLMRQILEDCPDDLKPEFHSKDYTYYFKNGSEIQLSGTESGHAEKLRGGNSDIFIVDEAQSCSDLNNAVKSILLPTTLTTRGRGILAGTPPEVSEHEFLNFVEEAQIRGSLILKTVDDNKLITPEQLEELLIEVGGRQSEKARRELWCEIIKDSKTSVVPEFNVALEKEIVKEWKLPAYFDAYEAMDTGGKDLTVVLYGYYDYLSDKVIIEDETVINFQEHGNNTKKLVEEIHSKEVKLWTNPLTHEYKGPSLRVSDIDYIFLNEIRNQSRILHRPDQVVSFQIAKKDNKDAAINTLRVMLAAKKIIINPRCTTLIRHLNNVKWNKNKTDFARSADDGHYDAVDALIYFVRHISFGKNPYPKDFNSNTRDMFGNALVPRDDPYASKTTDTLDNLRAIFGMKSKRKL